MGKHFVIHLTAQVWFRLTWTFFQNQKNHFVQLILKVWMSFLTGCDPKNSSSQ